MIRPSGTCTAQTRGTSRKRPSEAHLARPESDVDPERHWTGSGKEEEPDHEPRQRDPRADHEHALQHQMPWTAAPPRPEIGGVAVAELSRRGRDRHDREHDTEEGRAQRGAERGGRALDLRTDPQPEQRRAHPEAEA